MVNIVLQEFNCYQMPSKKMVTQDLKVYSVKSWNLTTQGSLLIYSFCHLKYIFFPVMCEGLR